MTHGTAPGNCEPLGDAQFVGIRAHDIEFVEDGRSNTLACTLVDTVESPFEMTLYLRLGETGFLEAELPLDEWREISQRPQPWKIRLPPERLLLLRG